MAATIQLVCCLNKPSLTLGDGCRFPGAESSSSLSICKEFSCALSMRDSLISCKSKRFSKCRHVILPFDSSKVHETQAKMAADLRKSGPYKKWSVWNRLHLKVHLYFIASIEGRRAEFHNLLCNNVLHVKRSMAISPEFTRFSNNCARFSVQQGLPEASENEKSFLRSSQTPCKSLKEMRTTEFETVTLASQSTTTADSIDYACDVKFPSTSDDGNDPEVLKNMSRESFVESQNREAVDGSNKLSRNVWSKEVFNQTTLHDNKQPFSDGMRFSAHEHCSQISFLNEVSSSSFALGIGSDEVLLETSPNLEKCSEGLMFEYLLYLRTSSHLDSAEFMQQPDSLSTHEKSSFMKEYTANPPLNFASTSSYNDNRCLEKNSLSNLQNCIHPCRIFVQGFPFSLRGNTMKIELTDVLSTYGRVEDIEFATYPKQSKKSLARGKHRGFAFVMMASPEEAKATIDNLNGKYFWGRLLTVGPGYVKTRSSSIKYKWEKATFDSKSFCKVFVGNLNKDTTGSKLFKIFRHYGQIVDAKIVKDLITKKSRCCAFVTFSNKEEAMSAIEGCDGSEVDGVRIKVNLPLFPK